ncbi:MAG: hypothetical protein ACAH80_01775 [Alphaproteobacteria bacterium]
MLDGEKQQALLLEKLGDIRPDLAFGQPSVMRSGGDLHPCLRALRRGAGEKSRRPPEAERPRPYAPRPDFARIPVGYRACNYT